MPNMPESLEGLAVADAEALRAEFATAFSDLYQNGTATLSAEQEETLVSFASNVKALDSHIETSRKAEKFASLAADVETKPDTSLVASGDAADAADNDADDEADKKKVDAADSKKGDDSDKAMAAEPADNAEMAADATEASTTSESAALAADTDDAALAADNTTKEDTVANDNGTGDALVASGAADSAADLMSATRAATAAHGANADVASLRPSVFAGTESGLRAGETTISEIAKAVDRKVSSSNEAQFRAAFARGQRIEQSFNMATIEKGTPAEFSISEDASLETIESVLARVADEKRLQGGSLTASGGWGAPSETDYSLVALETTDGLLNLPTVKINRGGLKTTLGPKFQDILANSTFHYTEAQDISGADYPKPQYRPTVPEFLDHRLAFDGAWVTAGLLMSKGYPELIERVLKGVLVAHPHRIDAQVIEQMVAGSTAVTVPTGSVDGIANLLTAIELQVGHMRQYNRLRMDQSLEIVLPAFTKEMLRAQMAARQYVDLISVTDARLAQFFSTLGVNVQFVYNWQDIGSTSVTGYTAFPSTIQFLLYPAGTWVKGTNDIITLGTQFDSNLLETNDYTALFTEEGWLVLKRFFDSRVVTVPTKIG